MTIQKSCNQCEYLYINGVGCHEIGCENSKKRWVDGEWEKSYECNECGGSVTFHDSCECGTTMWDLQMDAAELSLINIKD